MGDRRPNEGKKYVKRDDYGSYKDSGESSKKAAAPKMNKFWIPAEGIDRQVLQTEIQKFLGSDAYSSPMSNEVRSLPWDPDLI